VKRKKPIDLLVSSDRQYAFRGAVASAMREVLESMRMYCKVDTDSPNFRETPERVGRAWVEILGGIFDDGLAVREILQKTFPSKSDEMITVGPVQVWSMCPHHFLPVHMRVWISYVPNKKVLGLSKLARLAELISKRPALQEDTTAEIVKALQKGLQPKGSACVIKGRHLCMEMRGVKKEAVTTTTSLSGVFFKPEVRAEFLAGVRGDR
jgi:GTP cyclohydrolase I